MPESRPEPTEPHEPAGGREPADTREAADTPRGPDLPALVGGLAIAVLGGLLLLDALDALELGFAVLTPVALAALGAILLASGLARPS